MRLTVAIIGILLAMLTIQRPELRLPCAGALLHAAQERRLPPGHYCERAPPPKNDRAHRCSCHRRCIDTEQGLVITTDPSCQTYCHEMDCRCPIMECP